eukprot:263480-Chlamydomonas_euryale.AAC.2
MASRGRVWQVWSHFLPGLPHPSPGVQMRTAQSPPSPTPSCNDVLIAKELPRKAMMDTRPSLLACMHSRFRPVRRRCSLRWSPHTRHLDRFA